ncbi:MAG: glycosyltransferase family 1 protein [Candidatus Portnoybacteria bacterium]|nr:glycosyltransferase family 1 protein [Candidatus Portnoybacteria bacterium]
MEEKVQKNRIMLIGIDAHSLEGKRTGVGRVLLNLILQWQRQPSENVKFILYFKDEIPEGIPKGKIFEAKLLKSCSTAKFIHWNLWRAAKKDKLDVLFCPEYVGPIFYKGKIAVFLHDIVYEAHPEWFNWKSAADKVLLKWVSKKTAQKAEIVFTPLNFGKAEIIKHYGIKPEKIIITGEGVDPAFKAEGGKEAGIVLKKYGIDHKFFFYVASIFSRRHLREIIKAFLILAEMRPDLQFLIAGVDYTPGKSINQAARKANAELKRNAIVRVNFIPDEDLSEIYRNCEFFVWLSDYEGFGLPVVEAMSSGVPVMTTDGTSLKEVAGDAAYLIKNNTNINEIFEGMRSLLTDGILRQYLIGKGREQAKKFNWKLCADTILKRLSEESEK